jgi:flagellar motor switch protein FliM
MEDIQLPEPLTQDENNALLNAYLSANAASTDGLSSNRKKEVREYDFSRPDRFSKDSFAFSILSTETSLLR